MKRFEQYNSALAILSQAGNQDLSNEFVKSGVINKFHVQFELSWKLLKKLLAYEGSSSAASGSPRVILREAYRIFDFMDEELWLRMLRDRNDTIYMYDETLADQFVERIVGDYIGEFVRLRGGLRERYGSMLDESDDVFDAR